MLKHILPAFALLAALAGCNSKPTTITGGNDDPTAKEVATAPPVKLPPMMTSSLTYRCKDNSLIYVDFFNDGTTANIHTAKDGPPIALTAATKGEAYSGGGYTVTGAEKAITVTRPGGSAQACKA